MIFWTRAGSFLEGSQHNASHLFAVLASTAEDPDPIYQVLRIAVCRCEDPYGMTFSFNVTDVYDDPLPPLTN